MAPKRISILHKLPTPNNDLLFRALHNHPEVELQVYHLWSGSDRRPWRTPLGQGYPNYVMKPMLGVDLKSLRAALFDRDSLFIIGDWAHLPSLAIIFARFMTSSPVAMWVDTPQEQLPRAFWKRVPRRALIRFILKRIDVMFGTGQPAKEALVPMGLDGSNYVDLPFVVDLDRPAEARADGNITERASQMRASVGCCEDDVVFLMCGTLDLAKKAQDFGVRAFARLRPGRRVGLLIAGDGEDRAKLQRGIIEFGVDDCAKILGWLEPGELEIAYVASDVLVHPANYDPYPNVVIEAMNWGRPVIGTNASGSIRERVVDGESGFVVDPGDVEGLAAAMEALVTDVNRRIRFGQSARLVAEKWPVQRAVENVLGSFG